MSTRTARGFLIAVSVINGFLGLVCAALLLLAPDGRFLGMGVLLPVIATFPLAGVFFRDFFWIGVVMLLALGLPNLIAAAALLRRLKWQYLATLVSGVLLVLWCGFELIYMFNVAAVAFLAVGVLSNIATVWLAKTVGEQGHSA